MVRCHPVPANTGVDSEAEAKRLEAEIESVLKMNKYGRSYLQEKNNPTSRRRDIELIIKCSDDLGCLHMILLENPLLCKLNHE